METIRVICRFVPGVSVRGGFCQENWAARVCFSLRAGSMIPSCVAFTLPSEPLHSTT